MTTTSSSPDRAYVWIWLPSSIEPVLAGRVDQVRGSLVFAYAPEYLTREEAIPIYMDLPLQEGAQYPDHGIHGSIRDSGPDSWGQRVILNETLGSGARDVSELPDLHYLVAAGSDRIGALDFQVERGPYKRNKPRSAPLEMLLEAAEILDSGEQLPPEIHESLIRGSSIGGARPKALLDDEDRSLIAKFESSTDIYPVVQSEFVAMRLAALSGLNVPNVQIEEVAGRNVLLAERFDREPGGLRRSMVSALTMLDLGEMGMRYGSYTDLADLLRTHSAEPKEDLRELFARITFNVLVSNLDDHPRNTSAFWDGENLSLTPFYDVCPSPRNVGEVEQAMSIGRDGWRFSQLKGCVLRSNDYLLSSEEAREIIDGQVQVIEDHWDSVTQEARLTSPQSAQLMGAQFLPPFAFEEEHSSPPVK